ncbi:fibronectin type III domain-containing protein [Aquimarina agarilytica]|uniref:fibronectin type III domain-containing protein n=1 Tax=Aquimarina agarilytica TaxID=1087449 RepID=UPI000289C0B4|nr:T9SS type A sorting domain-containing protein [Aquimarina agarilytica]
MTKKLLVFITISLLGFIGNAQCPKPYQIDTNNKTTNSITLVWNSGSNLLTGDFEIEYGIKNFVRGTGTKINSIVTGIIINNLTSNTQYDFYITNNCGNNPTTSDVYHDVTIADYCNGDLFLDPGLEENYVGTYYESYNLKPNSTQQRIHLDFESFEVSSETTLKIWEGNLAIGDPLVIYDNKSLPSEPIISKADNGELYVLFESNNSQNNAAGWVGNITCVDKPACNMPKYTFSTNTTYNSITLRWAKSTSNRTFIEYGPKDFIIGTGKKVESFSNIITIPDLDELTEYDFYLTEECNDLSLSDTSNTSISTKAYCESNISFGWLEPYELNQIKIHNVDFQINEEWQVEYGLKGFTPGEGKTANYSSSDAIVGNLENDTEYDFYLRNKCDERFGGSIGPFSKKTNIDYCAVGKIYDRGGKEQIYTDYQRVRDKYIYLENNERARFIVHSLRLSRFEDIKIYDGPDSNSPLIKHFSRNSSFIEFVSSGNSTVIFFDIKSNNSGYTESKWDIDLICEPTPNCDEVTNFDVVDNKLIHNQCELNWTETPNSNDSYSIEYGLEGFERGTGTILNTNENFIILDNLTKSTSYQAYITTECAKGGQDNIYVEPLTFKTTPNYFGGDKFTDDGGSDNNIPETQTKITTIYPKADGERIRITFDYIDLTTRNYNSNSLKIYSGTDTSPQPIVQLNNTNDFINKGYSFPSDDPNGAITIEFSYSSYDSNYFSKGWEADIVSEQIPDCSEPFNISTTRYTHQEINLAWESETDVSEWKVEYGPAGFIRGEGLTKDTVNKNIVITGLSPNTTYDFYISSKCDNGTYNNYARAYKENTRQDFSSGVLLTSNDGITKIYPDKIDERVRFEFTYFDLEPRNNYNRSEVKVDFIDHETLFVYDDFYTFLYDSNLFPVISEKEDGTLSISQNIGGTSYWEAKISSEPKPTCKTTSEQGFLFQRVSNKEVELIWKKNDENTLYKVEYGPIGFSLGKGITKNFDSNRQFSESQLRRPDHTIKAKNSRFDKNLIYYSLIFDNLKEDTLYEFYISTICPDGSVNTYPSPKIVKTSRNIVKEGIYHTNSSGQMKQRKHWTILGKLENTTICPDSNEENIVATLKRLNIPESYYNGDPFTIFNSNNTKDESKILFSAFGEKRYYHNDIVVKASNESGCLTFNFSHRNSGGFDRSKPFTETLEDWNTATGSEGWIVEITSVPKTTLTLTVENIDINTTDIQLYPNPFKDYFFIKGNPSIKIKEITIRDILGRNIKKYFNINFNQKVHLDLPSGAYFATIKTENGNTIIKKILIK